jgi:hypothetical protein
MSFLSSEIVQKEVEECSYLRELSTELEAVATSSGDENIAVEYYHTLYALYDKQQIIYQRICLIAGEGDSPEADQLKRTINSELQLQGMLESQSVIQFLEESKSDIRQHIIDITGEDLDLPVDLG